jgi:MFS family permease
MGLDTASNATQLLGAIGALFFGGGIFGCLIGSYMADRWGRKSALALGSVLLIISAACLTGSVNVSMFIAFRFLNGMG